MRAMRWVFGTICTLYIAVLCATTTTYGWQSLGQSALNINRGGPAYLLEGSLTLEKILENGDGSELTPEQLQEEFAFIVTFSDGGTYKYRIDGGEEKQLESGGTLYLKHGQKAVFTDLPEGVFYHISEIAGEGYGVTGSGHQGHITKEGVYAVFRNIFQPDGTEEPGILKVTKVLAGDPSDVEKEFSFTLIIDGVEYPFTLKPGETIEFEIPAGSSYEVKENDYYPEGYIQSIINGTGVMIGGQIVEAVVTNTYSENPDQEIIGEKHWILNGADGTVVPQAIKVLLKVGDTVIEEKIVTADQDGRWLYSFDVPKYDENGQEIQYTIEEVPLENFEVSYEGYDIINTYIPPIVEILPEDETLPKVEKIVRGENAPEQQFTFILTGLDGAPMPEGTVGNNAFINITGAGISEIGTITFTKAGTYVYTLEEVDRDWENWEMDKRVYTLTYVVTEENGVLHVQRSITMDGQVIENLGDMNIEVLQFENIYKEPEKDDTVIIAGEKRWEHRGNPETNRPESVTVYIYGDGELVLELEVTEETDWKYLQELPRYAPDGHEIVYTIGEKPIPGYDIEIQGYNLLNIYHIDEEEEGDGGSSGGQGGSDVDTSDPNPVERYLFTLLVSLLIILQMIKLLVLDNRQKCRTKNKRR